MIGCAARLGGGNLNRKLYAEWCERMERHRGAELLTVVVEVLRGDEFVIRFTLAE